MNKIGLDGKAAKTVAGELNKLLANYSYFYQNTRGAHWNVKGAEFFELHEVFEELYTDLAEKIDEIAERILTLGEVPEHNFSGYKALSQIKETGVITDGEKLVRDTLQSLNIVVDLQRKILNLTDELDDEGTNALMSDNIADYEKRIWMFAAFLGE